MPRSQTTWLKQQYSLSCSAYIDNGPLEFVEALATNEKLFIESHAHPRSKP
jgi:hypothetical protein